MTRKSPFKTAGVVPQEVAISVSGLEFLSALRDGKHPAPPYAVESDIWITEVESGRVVFEAEPSALFYNPLGTVHGGWTSGLLDSAMGCAVHSLLKPGQAYTTVDMTINFVRPLFANTGRLKCEGKIIHPGNRIATSEGRVWDRDGKLIAHGSETCLIWSVPSATGS
jgi:uncharacterized protein (TIGR00369 family)